MRFQFPGTRTHVRLFHDVVTEDTQYKVVDCGLEYDDGGIDSLAIGGSFYTAEKLIENLNTKANDASTPVEAA